MDEAAPCTRSIHFGSFIENRRDSLQPGENTQNDEWEKFPHADNDQRCHDMVFSHPADWISNDADGQQNVVDQTKLVIQKPFPQNNGYHRRNHVREKGDSPNKISSSKRLVKN